MRKPVTEKHQLIRFCQWLQGLLWGKNDHTPEIKVQLLEQAMQLMGYTREDYADQIARYRGQLKELPQYASEESNYRTMAERKTSRERLDGDQGK